MALPNPPQNPNTPIPNNPFFAPLNPFVCGPYFPVAVSAGIDMSTGATVPELINDVGNVLAAGPGIALSTFLGTTTITATGGGGGSGTVTSITAGTGLTGGTITTSGTIALANTAVTAGAYTAANITVDAQGRITAAASGSGGGIPCSTITGKGALVTGTAASTPTALAVGTDGYVLTACAACTEGLTWIASSGAAPATPIVEGIVFGCTDGATSFNTALGYNALLAPTATGIANVAIGTSAGNAVTDGYGNTLIGPGTGCSVTTGTVNTAVGIGALCGVTSGSVNLGVGICSGCAYITETGNAVFGGYFGDPGDTNALILSDGAGNLKAKFDNLGALSFDGTSYGAAGEVLSSNGPGAKPTWIAAGGGSAIPCSCITAKGDLITGTAASTPTTLTVGTDGQALLACSTATNGICWGSVSAAKACPATLGTVYGYVGANIKSDSSIGLGFCSMAAAVNLVTNSALGVQSLCSLNVGSGNVAVGWRAMSATTAGCSNTAVGACAGGGAQGNSNVFIGNVAGCTQTSGDANVAIGPNTALASTTGSCQLAIGFSNTNYWLTGDSTKAIKPGAGIIDCAASTGTAGQVLMSNGSNALCWGSAPSPSAATPTVAGIVLGCTTATNVALGCNALLANAGTCNTALGLQAGCAVTTGNCNLLLGSRSGSAITTESNNVIVGGYAGSAGSDNTVSLSDGAGSLKLHVGQFGGWSVDGSTGTYGAAGQVLTSAGNFGAPSWTTIPSYQNSAISATFGTSASNTLTTDFGPSLNSLNYANNLTLSFRAVDAVTSAVLYYFYNGSMFASGATPFTQTQLANTLLDTLSGRLTVVLDFNTGYQNKPRLTITYVSGDNLAVTGNLSWINLSGDYA